MKIGEIMAGNREITLNEGKKYLLYYNLLLNFMSISYY